MKTLIRKSMNWISQHFETMVALCVLGIGQLASYLKLRHDVTALQKQSEQTEKTVDDHVASPVLHRTPDFEKGQAEIKAEMVRMNGKLDRVLERLPNRS